MAQKLIITRNVGKQDASKHGVDLYTTGQVVSVNEKEAHTLLNVLHVAEPWTADAEKLIRAVPNPATLRAAPAKSATTTVTETTDVAGSFGNDPHAGEKAADEVKGYKDRQARKP